MRLELETGRFYLGRDYSEALEAARAVPLHIALIPSREYISAALDGLDGILLPGSDTDVDPAYYGEEPHPALKKVVPEKDLTDLFVLEEAERRGIPVLAICYGMQALNVARGGTLIQDINSQVERPLKHEQGPPLARNSHAIDLLPDSVLSGGGSREIRVNSHHHQAIGKVGRDLRASAWANDGVIECIEDTRPERFFLGVQWHPELSWRTDELSQRVFNVFVERCAGGSAQAEIFRRVSGEMMMFRLTLRRFDGTLP
jgi:putative glutamine amidotransferase